MSPLRSSAGPGGLDERTLELGGDYLGERRLAEARRAGEQHVVERLAAPDAAAIETASWSLTDAWPTKSSSRRGAASGRLVVVHCVGIVDPRLAGRIAPRSCGPSALIAAPSAGRPRSAPRPGRHRRARAARRPQRGRSRGRSAPRGQASAGRRRAVIVISASGSAPSTFSRSSTMIRSAVRLPTPGLPAAAPRRRPRRAASSSRGGPPESTASATFGPTDCTPSSIRNSVALLLGGEAVERQRVVADDHVGVQQHVLADRRDVRSVCAETASR